MLITFVFIFYTGEDEQINRSLQGKSEQWEREDEDQSSTTEPTVREYQTYEQSTGRDTDEDASFSENEQILSKSFTSDEQQALREDAHPSNPSQYQHEIIDESSSRDQSELSKSSTETESVIIAEGLFDLLFLFCFLENSGNDGRRKCID